MSWGIDFIADVYLDRQDYNKNPYMVRDAIQSCEDEINSIESSIKMLCSATPKDIVPEEEKDNVLNWLQIIIEDNLSSLQELYVKKYKLSLYLEHLEDEKPE